MFINIHIKELLYFKLLSVVIFEQLKLKLKKRMNKPFHDSYSDSIKTQS